MVRAIRRGVIIKCANCKNEFELRIGDKVVEVIEQRDGNYEDYYHVKCIKCGHDISWWKHD